MFSRYRYKLDLTLARNHTLNIAQIISFIFVKFTVLGIQQNISVLHQADTAKCEPQKKNRLDPVQTLTLTFVECNLY